MAAEFDNSRFSAVDKFFGSGTEKATQEKKIVSSDTAVSRGKRRGGVGASNTSNDQGKKSLSSDLLAKQVLCVGRKRGRDDSNEDEYEGDGVDDHGVHDADEADGGRTSIVEKKPTKHKSLKPTKKLGKKERERQKQAAKAEAGHESHQSSDIATTDTTKEVEGDDAKQKEGIQQKTKKKRRKVRSRQKNIRKDNRSANEKPVHLIPGNQNYRGRPMTEATREKLNLPAPVKKPFRNNWLNGKGDDSSLFVIDRNPEFPGDDLGVKLAIDELMSSDDKGDFEKSASLDKSKDDEARMKGKSKSSKKKKKRFKNL